MRPEFSITNDLAGQKSDVDACMGTWTSFLSHACTTTTA